MPNTDTLTNPQANMLYAGWKNGNAWAAKGSGMGGAKRRMLDRLTTAGLLTDAFPRRPTLAGMQALAHYWMVRDANSGCMAYAEARRAVDTGLADMEATNKE